MRTKKRSSRRRQNRSRGASSVPAITRATRRRRGRRRRTDALGPARRHWNRRRDGACGSAPQLKNRPTDAEIQGLEDGLLDGSVRLGDRRSYIQRALRGIAGNMSAFARMEAIDRGTKRAWRESGAERGGLSGAEKRRKRKGGNPEGGPGGGGVQGAMRRLAEATK